MVGKTLGHYEILEPLGAGGMGEVYRAHDANLKRDVAIKVLPAALADDEARLARLQREAHLLASVNHPNIATIHNLEESGGVRWLVLELVEGTTLEEMLRRGALSTEEARRIGVQVAGALEAAHEKGIVHRDLKSANVMLDDKGRVKVLDFGIAKDLAVAGSGEGDPGGGPMDTAFATEIEVAASHLTATGVIVGTAPYMSPEQIRGGNIDKRTDNWAFGCLMYELLTGHRPFDRATMADTLSAVLEHEPDWDRLPADTPLALRSLIGRCLQKDVDGRLHDIADARVELEHIVSTAGGTQPDSRSGAAATSSWLSMPGLRGAPAFVATVLVVLAAGWGLSSILSRSASDSVGLIAGDSDDGAGGTTLIADAPAPHTIAVMPFESIRGGPEDGFAEELGMEVRKRLQSVSGMLVVSRQSSVLFKGQAMDPIDVGARLRVANLLYGDVASDEEKWTDEVSLVEASSGVVLWFETYTADLDLEGRYSIQESIARQVVAILEIELVGSESEQLATRPTENPQAYEVYLAGKRAQELRTPDALWASLDHFKRALELDPGFALVYVGIADTFNHLEDYAGMEEEVARAQARSNIDRALQLDPELGEAFKTQALLMRRGDDPAWPETFERAIALNPNDYLTYQQYGWSLWLTNEFEGAWRMTLRARDLDPLGSAANSNLGTFAFLEGRFDEAIGQLRLVADLHPEYSAGHMLLGASLHFAGRPEEAIDPLRRARELNPVDWRPLQNLVRALASLGRIAEAETLLNARIAQFPDEPAPYVLLGYIHRDVAGSLDEAVEAFEHALERAPGPGVTARTTVALAQVDLDRGDQAAAQRRVDALQQDEATQGNPWTGVGRLDLALYEGRYADPDELTRNLANRVAMKNYTNQWRFPVARQQPWEPLGYFGVLAGKPEDSRDFFEKTFPELLDGQEPPVHAFTLRAAIDLAAVLLHTGEEVHAHLLLERSEAYIDGLPEQQRRHQFRTAAMEIYALQGRTDDALDALQLAIDDGFLSGWWRLDKKPHFASLRDEPRFQEMVRQLREKATGTADPADATQGHTGGTMTLGS